VVWEQQWERARSPLSLFPTPICSLGPGEMQNTFFLKKKMNRKGHGNEKYPFLRKQRFIRERDPFFRKGERGF
jgi:hypothetical protein